jgi:hypothetical protein
VWQATPGGDWELGEGLVVVVEGLLNGKRREVEVGHRGWWDVGRNLGGLRGVVILLVGTPHGSGGKGEGGKMCGNFEGDERVELMKAVKFRIECRGGAERKKRRGGGGGRHTNSGPTDRSTNDVRECAKGEVGRKTLLGGGWMAQESAGKLFEKGGESWEGNEKGDLDVGCGGGGWEIVVAELKKGCNVLGGALDVVEVVKATGEVDFVDGTRAGWARGVGGQKQRGERLVVRKFERKKKE